MQGAKEEQIKNKFEEWIWKDQQRREKLEKLYNEKLRMVIEKYTERGGSGGTD